MDVPRYRSSASVDAAVCEDALESGLQSKNPLEHCCLRKCFQVCESNGATLRSRAQFVAFGYGCNWSSTYGVLVPYLQREIGGPQLLSIGLMIQGRVDACLFRESQDAGI